MNWHLYITADPAILVGKPIIKGTRIAVEFVLGLYAAGWSQAEILENYPHLTVEQLQAAFAFAAEMMREEEFVAVAKLA